MHIEIKKTFIEIVDDEALLLKRRRSAPALLTCKEPTMSRRTTRAYTTQESTVSCEPCDLIRHPRDAPSNLMEEKRHDYIMLPKTTVILRNIPPTYTRSMLLELLDSEGFACLYDFVYLPIKIKWNNAFGYAFINFLNQTLAEQFLKHFANFSRWLVPHNKNAEVDWSKGFQGLEAQVERYRDSPMMQLSSPDEMKPILLKDGVRVPFPKPKLSSPDFESHCSSVTSSTESGASSREASKSKVQCYAEDCENLNGVIDVLHSYQKLNCQERDTFLAQKKAQRSMKRIKTKLARLGHNQNLAR